MYHVNKFCNIFWMQLFTFNYNYRRHAQFSFEQSNFSPKWYQNYCFPFTDTTHVTDNDILICVYLFICHRKITLWFISCNCLICVWAFRLEPQIKTDQSKNIWQFLSAQNYSFFSSHCFLIYQLVLLTLFKKHSICYKWYETTKNDHEIFPHVHSVADICFCLFVTMVTHWSIVLWNSFTNSY